MVDGESIKSVVVDNASSTILFVLPLLTGNNTLAVSLRCLEVPCVLFIVSMSQLLFCQHCRQH